MNWNSSKKTQKSITEWNDLKREIYEKQMWTVLYLNIYESPRSMRAEKSD